jgi:hypothetical protein
MMDVIDPILANKSVVKTQCNLFLSGLFEGGRRVFPLILLNKRAYSGVAFEPNVVFDTEGNVFFAR